MKRAKTLTKRERKALSPNRPAAASAPHIHCISCGRHIEPTEFDPPASAVMLRCDHGSRFPSCVECEGAAKALVAEHDRSGKNVQMASAWH